MQILLNLNDLILADNNAAYLSLTLEDEQLTVTSLDKDLIPEGDKQEFSLRTNGIGSLTAKPVAAPIGFSAMTVPVVEHEPKGFSALTTTLEEWEPREDDLALPARKGSSHLTIGDVLTCQTSRAYGSKFVVTRIVNEGLDKWPIAYLRKGNSTHIIDLAPNVKRYWTLS